MTDQEKIEKLERALRPRHWIGVGAIALFVGSLVIAVGALAGSYHPRPDPVQFASQMVMIGLGFLKLGDLLQGYLGWMLARTKKTPPSSELKSSQD